jgi:GNAT superfamily N-acetyltransferase
MIATHPPKLICLPPAPMNGGPLDTAPVKVGEWGWGPKVDDRRVVVHAPSRTVWNQYGQLSVAMRDLDKFETALNWLQANSPFDWLDAGLMEYRHDMMRGSIVVFDLIDGTTPFDRRQWALSNVFDELPWATHITGNAGDNRVFVVPQFIGEAQGRALYKALREQNDKLGRKFYEGVVAKRLDSLYPTHNSKPKTETAAWMKHRFDQ